MKEEKQKIRARVIYIMLGNNPGYLKESMSKVIDEIGAKEKTGITVTRRDIKEPIKSERGAVATKSDSKINIDQKDFYDIHAEIEIESENLMTLMLMVFQYPPANLEVFSPAITQISNVDISESLNMVSGKLHAYDEVARVLQIEKAILESKLRAVMELGENREENTKGKSRKK
jgi:hypothetical protein